jgi:molybdate transport system ATP-binding protein
VTPALAAHGQVAVGEVRVGLALELAPGAVVGLVGPNGAGKSVTLRTLLGLHRLATGHVRVAGRVVDDGRVAVAPRHRGLGWVPPEPALLPRRPPLAQVTAFARPDAPLAGDISPAELLASLGLDPADRRLPRRLSSGQAQRVAIARALAHAGTVLLDEPLGAQDAAGAAAVRRLVRAHADAGGAVLLVAHRPEDAYLLADRLVVLDAGEVVQDGTAAELAAAPATPYVARVVGATVLDGVVDGHGVLSGAWGELVVAEDTPPGPAIAVVRPSAVVVAASPPTDTSARNILAGTVSDLRDTPGGLLVTVASRPPLVAALTHDAAARLELAPGRRVWAVVKAMDVSVRPH